jgi:hypothetical protein
VEENPSERLNYLGAQYQTEIAYRYIMRKIIRVEPAAAAATASKQ